MPTREVTTTKAEWIQRLRWLNTFTPAGWPDEVVSAAMDNQILLEQVEDGVTRAEEAYLNKYAKRDDEGAPVTREDREGESPVVRLGEGEYVEMDDLEAFQEAQQKNLEEEVTLEIRCVSPPRGFTLGQLRPIRWMVQRVKNGIAEPVG